MVEPMTERAHRRPVLSATVIVPSRDRPAMLLEAIESILTGEGLPAELIVVDDSRAPNAAMADLVGPTGCDVRYIWSGDGSPKSLSRALNRAIDVARSPVLAFTQDDLRVHPGWLPSLIGALQRLGPGHVVTGRVLPGAANGPGGFAPSLWADSEPKRWVGRPGRDVLPLTNAALYRAAFAEVGMLDERLGPGTAFPSAEDNDLGYRLLEAGYQVVYVPEAIVHHRAWRGPSDLLRLRWAYGRGQGAFHGKHLDPVDRYHLRRLVRDIGRHLRRVPRRALRDRRGAMADIVYSLGLVTGAAEWMLRHRWMR